MSHYLDLQTHLKSNSYTWLVTGVAGFIGSNLLQTLLKLNQKVIGLDNFSTGSENNLSEVQDNVSNKAWQNLEMVISDITDIDACCKTIVNIDFVLHQAALGSVPRSMHDPISNNLANINGFLNVLQAAKKSKIENFEYAASRSTYGDHPALPKCEDQIGKPLSPNADTFMRCYG